MKTYSPFFLLFLFLNCNSLTYELKKLSIDHRKIYLENFRNQTFEPFIHQELYDRLRERIHQRNSLLITEQKKNANYIITSSIILFRRVGLLYDNEMLPTTYQVDLLLEIRIYNNENLLLEKQEIFDSIRYSLKEGFIETDMFARFRLYDRITYKIVSYLEAVIYQDLQKKNDTNT